ncbi:MAG TPA: molybdopterin cofactor-binding domain-containing protein [Xanthobacteraceae bacterium]|nr:molybdopterin cofactor-binding domain-containing protein [Xanthobacteraceae bacterium]
MTTKIMTTAGDSATIETPALSRRGLLAGLGGLSFCLAFGADGPRLTGAARADTADAIKVTPWVRIAPDGAVTILTPGAEMGQGSMTSLPLILAEEMDADWSKVVIEWAPADAELYGYRLGKGREMAIVGSRAVMLYFNDLRMAGAQVRKVLIMNAAQKWGVDAASLRTEPGVVVDPASGRRLSYGEIAAFGQVPATLPAVDKSELKPKSQFRLIGKAVPRRDIPLKVNGTAQYAIDVRLPGMVYASALHSPAHGNEPDSWNDAEIKAMPGVIATVRLADGIAVAAESFEQAAAARRALKASWRKGKVDGFNSVRALEDYSKHNVDPAAKTEMVDAKGDAEAAFAGAAKAYKAEFFSDYSYHAQMEPLNAVARFNAAGDRVEVWDGSQDVAGCREQVAKALGFKTAQVEVNQCFMGGAFGRRSVADYTAEAALVARAVGRPVKLVWTREEDIAHGMFRPQAYQSIEAALDGAGKVVGWRHAVVGDGGMMLLVGGMKIGYYGVPNQSIELRNIAHGVRIKHWRGVAHNFNLFAIEGLVDQMAAAEGVDPIAFRLERMGATPRARKVFEAAARMADWSAKRPDGRALGIAISERSGSLGAGAVEISLNRDSGKIRVHKVWLAVDGGIIVQPEAAKANVESGIMYGLSNVLHERVTLKDGAVEQSNFNDYNVMRMSDMPEEINIAFLDSDAPPTGLGEVGTPFVMPAVANAFARLTGKRLYHMPFTAERVKAVLKA